MSTNDHPNIQRSLYDDNELLPLLITFPEIIDCKINTEQFLNASRAALKMIDRLGKVFTAIKYDMQNNIEKLSSKFKSDEEKNSTLQDMILLEINNNNNKNKFIIESILWLARELRMIQLIFSRIVEAHEMGDSPEELFPTIKDAYRESLEPYHGFMATQLFNLLSRNVPQRSELLLHLANGIEGREETTLILMEIYSEGIRRILLNLHRFMRTHNLGTVLHIH